MQALGDMHNNLKLFIYKVQCRNSDLKIDKHIGNDSRSKIAVFSLSFSNCLVRVHGNLINLFAGKTSSKLIIAVSLYNLEMKYLIEVFEDYYSHKAITQ